MPGGAGVTALAGKLGVSRAALEKELARLARRRLIEWRRGAHKAALNPSFGYVVGIDMGASSLRYALADFAGEILANESEAVRPEDGPQKTITQIKAGVRRIAQAHAVKGPLEALAIGVPSPVDPRTGLVAFANNLPGWRNIDLRKELARAFRVPVRVENDANAAAIGERWRGVARGAECFVFIALGTGIGSGVFVHGRLHTGRTGSAGELFRMNVEWQRWPEDFGDTGYFESIVSGLGIAALGREILSCAKAGEPAGLREERDAQFVFQAFRQGDSQARAVLEKVFTILAVGIGNIAAVLDPDLIVLGGGIAKGAPEFMLETVERVGRRVQPDLPPVRLSALGDQAQTYGAIYAALEAAWQANMARAK